MNETEQPVVGPGQQAARSHGVDGLLGGQPAAGQPGEGGRDLAEFGQPQERLVRLPQPQREGRHRRPQVLKA